MDYAAWTFLICAAMTSLSCATNIQSQDQPNGDISYEVSQTAEHSADSLPELMVTSKDLQSFTMAKKEAVAFLSRNRRWGWGGWFGNEGEEEEEAAEDRRARERTREANENNRETAVCSSSCWSAWTRSGDCSAPCGNGGQQLYVRSDARPSSCLWYTGCSGGTRRYEQCNRFCHNGGTALTTSCQCPAAYEGTCCENAVTCGDPGAVSNGHHSPGGTSHVYGTTVTFSCDLGYRLQGGATRTCGNAGVWSGDTPSCQLIECGDPGTPESAQRTVSDDFRYGSQAVFTCADPYTVQHGHAVRTCQADGTWSGVQPQCLVPDCECTGSGDVHYLIFDGVWTHHQGVCTYVLAQTTGDLSNETTPFSVYVNSKRRNPSDSVSYVNETYAVVYGHDIVLNRDTVIQVDGGQYGLPFTTAGGEVHVEAEGSYNVLRTDFGLVIRHYRGFPSSVALTVSGLYRGQMEGICGNCNGEPADDKWLRGTMYAGTDAEIGDSWRVEHHREQTHSCETPAEDPSSCEDGDQDTSVCDQIMTDASLQECRDGLGERVLADFLFACEYDVCHGAAEGVLCTTVQALVDRCRDELQVQPDWRDNFNCPFGCPTNSVYTTSLGLCPATCLDPQPTQYCYFQPMEGCVCAPGHVMSGVECTPLTQCGCVVRDGNGFTANYPSGSEWYSGDCLTKYACSSGVVTETQRNACDNEANCEFHDAIATCVCNQGYHGDGYTCQRVPCTDLPVPDNALVVTCDNFACSFTCADGYVTWSGDEARECLPTTQWSGRPLICQACPVDTYKLSSTFCSNCPDFSGTQETEANMLTGCLCHVGYSNDVTAGTACTDLDECLSDNGGCEETCTNTAGSYYCACTNLGSVPDEQDPARCIPAGDCGEPQAITNGGWTCALRSEINTQYCQPRCNDGFDFNFEPNVYEECGPTTGFEWSYELFSSHVDQCTQPWFPSSRSEADVFYFVDSCSSISGEHSELYRRAFIRLLQEVGVCTDVNGNTACSIDDVTVSCGPEEENTGGGFSLRRRRRQAEGQDMFTFNVRMSTETRPRDAGECEAVCTSGEHCDAFCVQNYEAFIRQTYRTAVDAIMTAVQA